jgi:hypothetical protein
MIEPHPVEALQLLDLRLPVEMGIEELAILPKDQFGALMQLQIVAPRVQAARQRVSFVRPPAGGDHRNPAGR